MSRRALGLIVGACLIGLLVLSVRPPSGHPASVGAMLTFHAAFVVLLALVPLRPRSHAYSALAVMLTLGFWTKFLIRLIVASPYLEPIGRFDASTPAWNHALTTITAGVLGVAIARTIHLAIARARHGAAGSQTSPAAPSLYVRHRRAVWTITALVAVASYVWNAYALVYVTGMDPRIVLPFKINAALSWWYVMGLPLWLAVLIGWELDRRGTQTIGLDLLWIPLLEGIVSAGSLLSRAAYLIRVSPYFLATTRTNGAQRLRIGGRCVTIAAIALAGFALSLAFVMTMRTFIFHPPPPAITTPSPASPSRPSAAPAPARTAAEYRRRSAFFAVREVGTLFLDRWTGMEGVLAVTAARGTPALLRDVVREDPAAGVDAIYQRLAGARYTRQPGLTFLTLAGPIALLALAGSSAFVTIGMGILAGILIAGEAFARWTLRNEIVCSVVAIGAGFMVSQVTFPRLLAFFFVELWVTLLVLALLRRRLSNEPS